MKEFERIKSGLRKIGQSVINKKVEIARGASLYDSETARYSSGLSTADILGYCFSKIAGKDEEAAKLTGALEGFQIAAIELNDVLFDNHYEKRGKPTVLGKYGRKYTKELLEKMLSLREICAERLKSYDLEVKDLAKEQFENTVVGDKLRNSWKGVPTLAETDRIVELVAGRFGSYIAKIASPTELPELEDAGRNVVLAIHTLEDLRDFISGEDLKRKKITFPLTYYYHSSDDSKKSKRKFAIEKTLNYVTDRLNQAKESLECFNNTLASFLKENLNCMINSINLRKASLSDDGKRDCSYDGGKGEDENDDFWSWWPVYWLPLWNLWWMSLYLD